MKTPKILTIGSANIDLVAHITRFPSVGQTVKESAGYEYVPGGKGANCAVAVARLGGESVFCAKLGNDTYGNKLASIYASSGIDTRFITYTSEQRTGLAMVMVESNGNNRIVAYPGSNELLSESDAENAVLCYPDAIMMQFEIPKETVLAAARYARELKIPLIVDAGPALRDLPLDQLGPLEIFSPNESETLAYTGINPNTMDNCLKACMALANRVEAKVYVLKLGSRGCYVYDGTYFHVMPCYPVEAVDTTAAGDVFTAAYALEYLRTPESDKDRIKRAAAYANAAAALSVTKTGAYNSIPTHDRVRLFAEANGIPYRF